MALSTRRSKDEEDEVLDGETELEDEEVGKSVTPAVSDRRRRRMLAQGLDPDAAVTTTKPKRIETIERDDEKKGRAKEGKEGGNIITRTVRNIRGYLRDVQGELNKVHWPNREETERLTRIVLIVTAAFSVALGAVSAVFGILATAISSPDLGTLAGFASIAIIGVVAFLWLIRDRIFPNYE